MAIVFDNLTRLPDSIFANSLKAFLTHTKAVMMMKKLNLSDDHVLHFYDLLLRLELSNREEEKNFYYPKNSNSFSQAHKFYSIVVFITPKNALLCKIRQFLKPIFAKMLFECAT
jgi:hypothetical protein